MSKIWHDKRFYVFWFNPFCAQSCHQTAFGEEDKEPLVMSSISVTADGFYNQLTREDQSFPYVCPF